MQAWSRPFAAFEWAGRWGGQFLRRGVNFAANLLARRFETRPSDIAAAAERPALAELVRTYAGATFQRWHPLTADLTGETAEIRAGYRLALAEPTVKAAMLGKVINVASLDLQCVPANKKNPRDKEIAEFVKLALERVKGGKSQLIWDIAAPGLMDGWSVGEKVFGEGDQGSLKGKWTLRAVKSKDTKWLQPQVDPYRNIIGLRAIQANMGVVYDPVDYVIYAHMPFFASPTGMSDLRAANRAIQMKLAAVKLRMIFLDKFTGPWLKGKYRDPATRKELGTALAQARASGYITLPEGSEVEVVELAVRGTADFKSAIDDLDKEIVISVSGAFLHMMEGTNTDARGNSVVQKSTSELFVWYLADRVSQVINEQIVPDLVVPNFGTEVDYPTVTLSAVNAADIVAELGIDEALARIGVKLSAEELYERTGRSPPSGPEDAVGGPPPQPPGGGPGGGGDPFGAMLGGGNGGGGEALPFAEGDAELRRWDAFAESGGFTGTITDSLGRTLHYRAGKRVKAEGGRTSDEHHAAAKQHEAEAKSPQAQQTGDAIRQAVWADPERYPKEVRYAAQHSGSAGGTLPHASQARQARQAAGMLPDGDPLKAQFEALAAEHERLVGPDRAALQARLAAYDARVHEKRADRIAAHPEASAALQAAQEHDAGAAELGEAAAAVRRDPRQSPYFGYVAEHLQSPPSGTPAERAGWHATLEDDARAAYDELRENPDAFPDPKGAAAFLKRAAEYARAGRVKHRDAHRAVKSVPKGGKAENAEPVGAFAEDGGGQALDAFAEKNRFTGVIKDSKGREYHYQQGKRVKTPEGVSEHHAAQADRKALRKGGADYIPNRGDEIGAAHVHNLRQTLSRLGKGDVPPDEAGRLIERHHAAAAQAERTNFAGRLSRLRESVRQTYGDEALQSPEWAAVIEAGRQGHREAVAGLARMTEAAQHFAALAQSRGRGVDPSDLAEVNEEAEAHHRAHRDSLDRLSDALGAFKAKHKPKASPPPAKNAEPPAGGPAPGAFLAGNPLTSWLGNAEWDEAKHARDHGKFASKPGAGGRPGEPDAAAGDDAPAGLSAEATHPKNKGKLRKLIGTAKEAAVAAAIEVGKFFGANAADVLQDASDFSKLSFSGTLPGLGLGGHQIADPVRDATGFSANDVALIASHVLSRAWVWAKGKVVGNAEGGDAPDRAEAIARVLGLLYGALGVPEQFTPTPDAVREWLAKKEQPTEEHAEGGAAGVATVAAEGRDVALAGADGRRIQQLLRASQERGVEVLYNAAKSAAKRLLSGSPAMLLLAPEFLNDAEREGVAEALAATNATAELLGRARVRERMRKAAERGGLHRFAEGEERPFDAFAESVEPLPPEKALEYFRGLLPKLGVDPERFGPLHQRRAFTLAVNADEVLLARVKEIVREAMLGGRARDAAPDVEDVLERAGVSPKNPQYSEMVYRTNAMDAYTTGTQMELQEPEVRQFFPVWRYEGIKDGRQGKDHEPHFGRYYPVTAAFAEVRGPRPFNCRCCPIPIDKYQWEDLQAKGASVEARW